MTDDMDPRLDLPGATTPPVEGRRWLWVKLGVWGVALALIIGAAWSVAWVLSNVRVRLDLPPAAEAPAAEAPAAETPPSYTAPPEAAPASYENDEGEVITRPVWLQAPRPEYPERAQRAGAERGMARLECQAGADGHIRSCRIVEESPVGVGFGQQAVAATMRARVQPRLVDGHPVESRVAFTARYRLE